MNAHPDSSIGSKKLSLFLDCHAASVEGWDVEVFAVEISWLNVLENAFADGVKAKLALCRF